MPAAIRFANALLHMSHRGSARRFPAALAEPRKRQLAVLQRILQANAGSRYGETFDFARLGDVAAYQAAVPVVDYDALLPWIEAIKAGESGVLTQEPVLMLEKSSGSTAAAKYIPYTASLRAEFQRATAVWLHDLLACRPALRPLGSYWSVSPAAQVPEVTAGGLRVGFEDDTEYFGALERWVLGRLILTPPELKRVPTMAANRYVTWRHLLARRQELGLISVWNPSFLTLLLQQLPAFGERLVHDLRRGTLTPPEPLAPSLHATLSRRLTADARTADWLASLLREGVPVPGTAIWPNLRLISCWTDGVAARFVPELREAFPGVEIQGKGLLATEGVVSFPLLDHLGAVPALDSHFLEFVPEHADRHGKALLVDELQVGGRYQVLLTTGGGLYRYALNDLVEVVDHLAATPLIRFVGKTAKLSDVVGEKLNERHVGPILEEALADLGATCPFVMLAPEWGTPPCYILYIEAPGLPDEAFDGLAGHVERRLRDNHHYAYARDLGQLAPVRVQRVTGGQANYMLGCEALGQRVGDIKPTYLHPAFGWSERLGQASE